MPNQQPDAERQQKYQEYAERQRTGALTKLVIYFPGNTTGRTFYSMDKPADIKERNIWPGFNGLKERLVEKKFKDQYKTANIYINQPDNTGKLLAQWIDGHRVL